MHLPPCWPPETPMALRDGVARPGRRILENSAASLPGQSRRSGVRPRPSRPCRCVIRPFSPLAFSALGAAARPDTTPVRAVATSAPLGEPPACPAPRPTTAPPPRPLPGQKRGFDCVGSYSGAAGAALSFAARAMIGTDQTLPCFATERDGGLRFFGVSVLAKSRHILLPHYGFVLQQALQPEDGFVFWSVRCSGCTDPESRAARNATAVAR